MAIAVCLEQVFNTLSVTSVIMVLLEHQSFFIFLFLSSGGGHFFNRNSMSPRSLVCEMELPEIQASLDLCDDNKSWGPS